METNPVKPSSENAVKALVDRLNRLAGIALGIKTLLTVTIILAVVNLVVNIGYGVASMYMLRVEQDNIASLLSHESSVENKPFTYEYEIINAKYPCLSESIDSKTWEKMSTANLVGHFIEEGDYEIAIEAAKKLNQCVDIQLKSIISQRGAEGWRLVSFEAMKPLDADLGFEFNYRFIWAKP